MGTNGKEVEGMTKLYTLRDLSHILAKSKSTIYHNWKKWVSDGRMQVMIINCQPRFHHDEVLKLLKSFEPKKEA